MCPDFGSWSDLVLRADHFQAAMYAWRSIYWSEQVSMRTRALIMFDWIIRWVASVRTGAKFALTRYSVSSGVWGRDISRL